MFWGDLMAVAVPIDVTRPEATAERQARLHVCVRAAQLVCDPRARRSDVGALIRALGVAGASSHAAREAGVVVFDVLLCALLGTTRPGFSERPPEPYAFLSLLSISTPAKNSLRAARPLVMELAPAALAARLDLVMRALPTAIGRTCDQPMGDTWGIRWAFPWAAAVLAEDLGVGRSLPKNRLPAVRALVADAASDVDAFGAAGPDGRAVALHQAVAALDRRLLIGAAALTAGAPTTDVAARGRRM